RHLGQEIAADFSRAEPARVGYLRTAQRGLDEIEIADAVRACGAVQREAEAIADRGRERRVRESDPVRFGLGRERDWLWRGAVAARDRGEIGSKLREAQLWRPHVLEVERSRDAGVVERPLHGTIEGELANLDFTCPGGS